MLDLKSGRLLGKASSDAGVDVIAYDPKLAHVYLPSADSGTIAIVGISSSGGASVLKTAKTVEGAHCVPSMIVTRSTFAILRTGNPGLQRFAIGEK